MCVSILRRLLVVAWRWHRRPLRSAGAAIDEARPASAGSVSSLGRRAPSRSSRRRRLAVLSADVRHRSAAIGAGSAPLFESAPSRARAVENIAATQELHATLLAHIPSSWPSRGTHAIATAGSGHQSYIREGEARAAGCPRAIWPPSKQGWRAPTIAGNPPAQTRASPPNKMRAMARRGYWPTPLPRQSGGQGRPSSRA